MTSTRQRTSSKCCTRFAKLCDFQGNSSTPVTRARRRFVQGHLGLCSIWTRFKISLWGPGLRQVPFRRAEVKRMLTRSPLGPQTFLWAYSSCQWTHVDEFFIEIKTICSNTPSYTSNKCVCLTPTSPAGHWHHFREATAAHVQLTHTR